MEAAVEILETLATLGVTVKLVAPDRLRFQPASKILVSRIRQEKPAILEALRTRPAENSASPVMTIRDLPALAQRFRAQGWIVKRVGDELICTPPRPWHRVQ